MLALAAPNDQAHQWLSIRVSRSLQVLGTPLFPLIRLNRLRKALFTLSSHTDYAQRESILFTKKKF